MKIAGYALVILTICVASAPADGELKAAFVYVGPIGDGGWTYAHNDGRKSLEELGVQTTYVETVPEGAEAERTITRFAAEGYDLIFTTSFGYMDSTIKVADRFPQVVFGHCSGYKRAKNVFTYFGRMYQPHFLLGIIAGRMTKAAKLGYVAPHPIPEVIRHINAFALGARSVNSDVTVHVVWTGAWFDPGKEKDAAIALMDAGCDLIATGADSPASMQAAQQRGFYSFGYNSDGREFAPESFLTAPIWDWSVVYDDVVQKLRDGFTDWQNLDYWQGMESGVVKLAPLSKFVPADIAQAVDTMTEQLRLKDDIFLGPIKAQDGSIRVEEGARLSDQELLSMTWFVDGVVGEIPQ